MTPMDLSALNTFINFTLDTTTHVREVIQAECDEAKSLFLPWTIESFVTREIGDHCICEPVSPEQKSMEIAMDLDKALAQAQALRHKVSKNISGNRCYKPPINALARTSKTSFNHKISKDSMKLHSDTSSHSPPIVSSKLKSKNFIAENKSKVKMMSQQNANVKDRQLNEDRELVASKSNPSISEINKLIKKLSLNMEKKPAKSKEACPCHSGNDLPKKTVTEQKQEIINLAEALDRFGVPDYVLSINKAYQSFTQCITKKLHGPDVAAKKFLEKLEKQNETRLRKIGSNPLIKLVQGFQSLHRDLHENLSPDPSALDKLKQRYIELDGLSKYNSVEILKTDVTLNREINPNVERGWSSNGIWNWTNLHHFTHLSQVPFINYTNKQQLLDMFDTNQRLQLSLYRHDLLDLLLEDVIPKIRKTVDPTSKEYLALYKMLFAIAQVINPKLPLLVETE